MKREFLCACLVMSCTGAAEPRAASLLQTGTGPIGQAVRDAGRVIEVEPASGKPPCNRRRIRSCGAGAPARARGLNDPASSSSRKRPGGAGGQVLEHSIQHSALKNDVRYLRAVASSLTASESRRALA